MKRIFLLFICLATTFFAHAQSNEVTLVVSGEGPNKTEAAAMALRSAIEQAFGTFVSANTEILNDEIIKEDVSTVSSGNIKSYRELSAVPTDDGYNVTLQAVVSINKLIEYTKSHGGTAEYAGQIFAMNIKMKKLNKKNEAVALDNLLKELTEISKNMFDLSIDVNNEPYKVTCNIYKDGEKTNESDRYSINVTIKHKSNGTTKLFYDALCNTLSALSLTDKEMDDYNNTNEDYYSMAIVELPEYHSGGTSADWYTTDTPPLVVYLRNNPEIFVEQLGKVFHNAIYENTKLDLNGCSLSYSYMPTEYEYKFFPASGYYWVMKHKNYLSCPQNKTMNRFGEGKKFYNKEKTSSLTMCQTGRNDITVVPLYNWPLAGVKFESQWSIYYVKQNYYDRERIPQKRQQKRDGIEREHIIVIEGFRLFSSPGNELLELCFDIPIKEEDLMNLTGFGVHSKNVLNSQPKSETTSTSNPSSNMSNSQVSATTVNESQDEIFQIVEEMPVFPMGEENLMEYVDKNIKYPQAAKEKGIQGRVFVSFIVEPNGSISNVKVLRGIGNGCDEEAIRVIKSMPKWKPGKQRGQAVRVSYQIPVTFQLPK